MLTSCIAFHTILTNCYLFDIQIFLKVLNNCYSIVIEYYSTTQSIRNFENIQNTMLIKQLYGSWDFKIKIYLVGEMVKLCSICFLYLFHTINHIHICKYICPSVLQHMTEFTSTVRLDSNIFFPTRIPYSSWNMISS